jgi:hypothetical protein
VRSLRGLIERIRINEGHARMWTVIGAVAAVVALPLSAILAVTAGGNGTTGALTDSGTEPAPTTTVQNPVPPPRANDTVSPSPDSSNPPKGPDPESSVASAVLFEGQVRLQSGTGVDLEAGQVTGKRVDGPNGSVDLHFDVTAGLRANGGNIYEDRNSDNDAESHCLQYTTEKKDGRPAVAIYGSGGQYCFLTSDEHLAWLRVNDISGISTAQTVVVDVRVWASA